MAGISSVVKQLVEASPQAIDNPQVVLFRVQAVGKDCFSYCRQDVGCNLLTRQMPSSACQALKAMVGDGLAIELVPLIHDERGVPSRAFGAECLNGEGDFIQRCVEQGFLYHRQQHVVHAIGLAVA